MITFQIYFLLFWGHDEIPTSLPLPKFSVHASGTMLLQEEKKKNILSAKVNL